MSRDGFETAEVSRRLDLVVADGTITSVAADGRVRVLLEDELETDELPLLGGFGGGFFAGSKPAVGEPVVVISPTGELTQGRVIRGMNSALFPHPLLPVGLLALLWSAGEMIDSYDKTTKTRIVRVPAGGRLRLLVEGGAEILLEGDSATIKAATVNIGPEGVRKGVARIGDAVVNGVITGGSLAVKAS